MDSGCREEKDVSPKLPILLPTCQWWGISRVRKWQRLWDGEKRPSSSGQWVLRITWCCSSLSISDCLPTWCFPKRCTPSTSSLSLFPAVQASPGDTSQDDLGACARSSSSSPSFSTAPWYVFLYVCMYVYMFA